jgi:tRNA modification GTPase
VTAGHTESRTLAAVLTPAGTSAIAALAIRGPRAWIAVRDLFRPLNRAVAWPPEQVNAGQFWVGRFGAESGKSAGDEVVLAVKRIAPVPWVEVHCHGGIEVVRWILETLQERGIQVCSWQELERQTIADPLLVAAMEALAQASTTRTAAILLDQYHGAFGRAIAPTLTALDRGNVDEATHLLGSLVRFAALGRHLTQPWRVAVMGAPNVGKSSLVNALAGYQRSIVAPTPGTTRDVVTTLIAVDGWPIELADTAGLREATEMLEGQGIERARSAGQASDLRLWMLDATAPPVFPPLSVGHVLLVVNKIDLPSAWDLRQAVGAMPVSALKGDGVPELCQQVSQLLVPDVPQSGADVPFTAALAICVEQAYQHFLAGHAEEAGVMLRKGISFTDASGARALDGPAPADTAVAHKIRLALDDL